MQSSLQEAAGDQGFTISTHGGERGPEICADLAELFRESAGKRFSLARELPLLAADLRKLPFPYLGSNRAVSGKAADPWYLYARSNCEVRLFSALSSGAFILRQFPGKPLKAYIPANPRKSWRWARLRPTFPMLDGALGEVEREFRSQLAFKLFETKVLITSPHEFLGALRCWQLGCHLLANCPRPSTFRIKDRRILPGDVRLLMLPFIYSPQRNLGSILSPLAREQWMWCTRRLRDGVPDFDWRKPSIPDRVRTLLKKSHEYKRHFGGKMPAPAAPPTSIAESLVIFDALVSIVSDETSAPLSTDPPPDHMPGREQLAAILSRHVGIEVVIFEGPATSASLKEVSEVVDSGAKKPDNRIAPKRKQRQRGIAKSKVTERDRRRHLSIATIMDLFSVPRGKQEGLEKKLRRSEHDLPSHAVQRDESGARGEPRIRFLVRAIEPIVIAHLQK